VAPAVKDDLLVTSGEATLGIGSPAVADDAQLGAVA
jgi:hypothetical protein